jgi:uncharacterized protein HemX
MTAPTTTQASGPDYPKPAPPESEPPFPEESQPDPMLRLGAGRVTAGGLALLAVVAALVLGVVFYGLNSPNPINHAAASSASTQSEKAAG